VEAGGRHAVARRSDGSLVGWGFNGWGQIDIPSLPAGVSYVEFATGEAQTLLRRSDDVVVVVGGYPWSVQTLPPAPVGYRYVSLFAGIQNGVPEAQSHNFNAGILRPNASLGTPFCFGDGSLPTPCPCAPPNTVPNPSGATGNGCASSFDLEGAHLRAFGTVSPDTVRFDTDFGPSYFGFASLVKGSAKSSTGLAHGDGVACTDGVLWRFGGHNAGTGGASVGSWTYPNTVQTKSVSAATLQAPGSHAFYQLFYRNAAAGFCSSGTTNWSNGVEIAW
jgi:hypothetical protein